jgi:hypothetical protein
MSPSRPHALICGALLVACAAPEPAPEDGPDALATPAPVVAPPTIAGSTGAPNEMAPPAEAPPAASEAEGAPPTVAADEAFGIPSCDAYAERYRACIADRLAPVEREAHTRALQAQVATWRVAKADPKLAPALDSECAAAAEAARATTRVFGCVWREDDAAEPEQPKPGRLKPEVVTVARGLPANLDLLEEFKAPQGGRKAEE